MQTDFFRMPGQDPHKARARAILEAHPEVRRLFGRNPWTAAITLAIVVAQAVIACWLGTLGLGYWWLALLVALSVGVFANHALYVVIHDATHDTVFRSPFLNRMVLVLADLPNVVPGAIGFRSYHLLHHSGRSRYDVDPDIPNVWEARLVRDVWWRKAIWLFCFPFLQLTRIHKVPPVNLFSGWAFANYFACAAYVIAISWFFGLNGAVYLFSCFWFSTGLHPLGARWISEHYTLDPSHDTTSYYGPINKVALNIGFHNEHHDFPRIPWNHLPQLRVIAPEYYETLPIHTSWTRLFVDFLFDKRYTLFARVVRTA